jgi:hypothetical protein
MSKRREEMLPPLLRERDLLMLKQLDKSARIRD